VLILLLAAFVAGGLFQSPTDAALEVARDHLPVEATVEERVVSDGFAFPATVVSGSVHAVTVTEASSEASPTTPSAPSAEAPAGGVAAQPNGATAPTTAERVVVTAGGAAAGSTLSPGDVIAEISGRPLFAIPGDIPLYRNIAPGESGNDVRALQQFLLDLGYGGGPTPGTLDAGTIAALGRLYRDANHRLPYIADGVQGVAWREFAPLPSADPQVISAAPVGTVLGPDVPVMSLQTSAPTLTARVTVLERDEFAPGAPIGVSAGGGPPVATTVIGVGEFGTDEATGVSGHPLTVAVPEGIPLDGSRPLVLVNLDPPAPTTAVPAVAIRQEGGEIFVLVAPEGDKASPSRVPVTVIAQADGWVAISPDERLPVGSRVLLG
jgi:hypothetical protein